MRVNGITPRSALAIGDVRARPVNTVLTPLTPIYWVFPTVFALAVSTVGASGVSVFWGQKWRSFRSGIWSGWQWENWDRPGFRRRGGHGYGESE